MYYNYVLLVGTFQKLEVLENTEIITLEDEDESGKLIVVRGVVKMNNGQLQLIANEIIVSTEDGNKELL